MEEDIEKTDEETSAEEAEDEDEGRPPVDPNNKLYTFLSLLIFAVLYAAYQLISQHISFVYAMYTDSPSEDVRNTVLSAMEIGDLSSECSLQYMRLHRNFDSGTLYVSFSLPDNGEDDLDELAEKYIPYAYGDGAEDERFAVYPSADMTADYVYGNSYVSIDDPSDSCIIFENASGYTAVFRTTDYDARVREAMSEGIKINVNTNSR